MLLPAGNGAVAVLSRDGAVPESVAGEIAGCGPLRASARQHFAAALRAAEQVAQLGQPFAHAFLD